MEPQLRDEANPNRLASVTAWAYSAWPPIAIIISGLVVAGVTRGYTQLQQLCSSSACSDLGLHAELLDILIRASIAPSIIFAVYGAGMVMLVSLLSIFSAAFIYFRRQEDPSAIFVVYFLTLSGTSTTGVFSAIEPSTIISEVVIRALPFLSIISVIVLFITYQQELLKPKWTRPGLGMLMLGGVSMHPVISLLELFDFGRIPSWTSLTWLKFPPWFYLAFALIPVAFVVLSRPPRRSYNLWPTVKWPIFLGGLTLVVVYLYVPAVNEIALQLGVPISRLQVLTVLVTLLLVGLITVWGKRLGYLVSSVLVPDRITFRETFAAFTDEVRTVVDLDELLSSLVNRTAELFNVEQGAVYLWASDQQFRMVEQRNISVAELTLGDSAMTRLMRGEVILQAENPSPLLLVPLNTPNSTGEIKTSPKRLLGILALGPRQDGKPYSGFDRGLLLNLAGQAGTAVHVAQLVEQQREDLMRRAEYERSPLGRAETLGKRLGSATGNALKEILWLARSTGDDPDTKVLFDHLPQAMSDKELAGFTEGCRHVLNSLRAPELLSVGLRQMTTYLSNPAFTEADCQIYWANRFYVFSLSALNAASIAAATNLLPTLDDALSGAGRTCNAPPEYIAVFDGLAAVVKLLHAVERVDAGQDKLAFLASGLEALNTLNRRSGLMFGSGLDSFILRGIVERWQTLITTYMSDLQSGADLAFQLITRNVLSDAAIALVILVTNRGRGAATNIEVNLEATLEDAELSNHAQITELGANQEQQVSLRLQRADSKATQFRAQFRLRYDDARAFGHEEYFAEVVHLFGDTAEFEFIPNPYVVGTPLQAGSSLFFGRDDVFVFIEDNLQAAHRNNLILIGQRRTGKSSVLKQLPSRLGDKFLAVYLDAQSFALNPDLPSFFFMLAYQITFALEDRGFEVHGPGPEDFAVSPITTFEHRFLSDVRHAIGGRHLLMMFDEFEELESAVHRGLIDVSVFSFLRHLVQHHTGLSLLLCGTHRIEELTADYWNELFNLSLYKHVGFLDQTDSLRLIQEPVARYNMRYDDLALDKMWRITAGHPYLLQLLCHSLVRRHNQFKRNYITIADLNAALDEILTTGEAHFSYMWTQSADVERLILTVLCRMITGTLHTTAVQVDDFLIEQRNFHLSRRVVGETLERLANRDILQMRVLDDNLPVFSWKLSLLALWIEKKKSLSRVLEEFNGQL